MNANDALGIGLTTLVGFVLGYWQGSAKRAQRVNTARLFRTFRNAKRRRHNDRPPL